MARIGLRGVCCASISLAALAIALPAAAQDTDDEEAAANEQASGNTIFVTGLRRTDELQDTPAAITAFTADTIEDARIVKPADFINLTPNVTLVETQNAGNAFIVIRGITQARNSEPSVAVVVDGVQQVNPAQFNQDLFDIEQIEVLKGPQGGLYGRNAIGGAIIIRTKEPTDEFEGKVTAGVDNGFGYFARGGISGPISDSHQVPPRRARSTTPKASSTTRSSARRPTPTRTSRCAGTCCSTPAAAGRSTCAPRSTGSRPRRSTSTSSPT